MRDFDYGLQGHNHKEADTLIVLHCFQIAKLSSLEKLLLSALTQMFY